MLLSVTDCQGSWCHRKELKCGAAARLLPLQVTEALCSSAAGIGTLWAPVSPPVKQSVAEEQRAWSVWPKV